MPKLPSRVISRIPARKLCRQQQRPRQRHAESGRWGLDGPAIEALRGAIEIYEEVLRASSAQQMEHAQGARLRALQRQQAQREGVAA